MRYIDSNMNISLILLFVFDKMEVAITEDTLVQMCSVDNDWVAYMDCIPRINSLCEDGFIVETNEQLNNKKTYIITTDGRLCLSYFYTKIPVTLREKILKYVKDNRTYYRKIQEYFSDYIKNADGTYTVILKIQAQNNLMEIKLNVENIDVADKIYKSWINKGSQVYESLHELLIEST